MSDYPDVEIVRRLHWALAKHPAPNCLTYDDSGPACKVTRLVTETAIYETGPVRDWLLQFGKAILHA